MQSKPPLDSVHLLPIMDDMLFSLLRSLTPEEWQAQTIAKKWKVKDVVAHLLDGNIRKTVPHTYRSIDAPVGTTIAITIAGEIGDTWHGQRMRGNWYLIPKYNQLRP
jgi:hypothetical protein